MQLWSARSDHIPSSVGSRALANVAGARLDCRVGPRRKPVGLGLGLSVAGARLDCRCGLGLAALVLAVGAHQPVPEHHVLREVGVGLAVVRLVRTHGVVDAEEAQLQVVARVVEAGAQRLEAEVRTHRGHVQPRTERHDVHGRPVQRERDDLLDGVLVRRVDVSPRREGVTVVVLVHISVDCRQVHEAVRRGVHGVVDHEQQPEGDGTVEQAEPGGQAHDERRVPQQVQDLLREDVLDRRVDREIGNVHGVESVLEDGLRTGARGQRRQQWTEHPH
eukprot:scaffold11126_cov64-Phaeocystis_antarctica.AAC.6